MFRCFVALFGLLLLTNQVAAGPNADGVLLVHYNSAATVPNDPAFVDGELAGCDSAVVDAPADSMILWYVYAAFPAESNPRLKVVTFGCEFSADSLGLLWSATRPGATQIFYPDTNSWPYTGSGTAIGFDEALTGTLDEVYCFAGYAYSGQRFSVVAHPDQGGTMADDGTPSSLDTIEGYGSLGFGVSGVLACPEESFDFGGLLEEVLDELPSEEAVTFTQLSPDSSRVAVLSHDVADTTSRHLWVLGMPPDSSAVEIALVSELASLPVLEVQWISLDCLWVRGPITGESETQPSEVCALASSDIQFVTTMGLLKPVSEQVLANSTRVEDLRNAVPLSDEADDSLASVLQDERDSLLQLKIDSDAVAGDTTLTLSEKQDSIAAMGYDDRLADITQASRDRLSAAFTGTEYEHFVRWINTAYVLDYVHYYLNWECGSTNQQSSRTDLCMVWATQYNASTSWEVSLPDKYLKFANRGWQHYPGYPRSDYSVDVERESPHYEVGSVIVWDVGPWNEDDNYTSTPIPRRMFWDLPNCTPEAEAAYYEGYNHGRDQFGRLVLSPAGIDLSRDVAAALHFGSQGSDWVWVTYYFDYSTSGVGTSRPDQMEPRLIYNNPTSGPTRISLQLAERGRVSLSVFDVAGRHLQSLADGELPAGVSEFSWQPPGPGVYFLQLVEDSRNVNRRVVVVR